MNSLFKDKVILVTGASSGIGYHTALSMAQMGAKLVLMARRKEKLDELKERIELIGSEAVTFAADVSSKNEVQQAIDYSLEQFGRIDILIANAGQYIQSQIVDATVDLFEQSMSVNFYGILHCIQSVLPSMMEVKSGHIVIVNSLDAKKGIVGDGPYVAAKSALDGLGDVLRQEMKGTGVKVTSVYPARVDTDMIDKLKVPGVSPKMPVEKVVKAIIKGIKKTKATVYVPGRHSTLGVLNDLLPGFMDWFYAKYKMEGKWEE